MIVFWTAAFRAITSMPLAWMAALGGALSRMDAQPMIALSGVRSSWETVARNSSLIRFACSAAARARCFSSSSRRRRARVSVVRTRATSCRPEKGLIR